MATHGKAEEAKLQSKCVLWMWNENPETRGCFFSVENEGTRISSSIVREQVLFIMANLQKPQSVLMACRKLLDMCNNGNAVAGAQARGMGVTAGVSDCLFMWKGLTYCFEFKTQTGRQSEKQEWWQSIVEKNNFKYFIIRDFDVFVACIKSILA